MCIHCNMPDGSSHLAEAFLNDFAASRDAMAKAAASMKAILREDLDPDVRRRYDALHKAMRRHIRTWNALEEAREHGPA